MTQAELGELLGITKQAISKMGQNEKLEDDKIKQVAEALGVTEEGLKNFTEETVLYCTNNFYENCGVKTSAVSNNHTFNNFPIEEAMNLLEKLIEKEREKFESLKKEKE